MILYPAIDLKDGACVRLLRGDMNAVTVYNDDPAEQARRFAPTGKVSRRACRQADASALASASTSATCPGTFTLRQIRRITPSLPIR